MFFKVAPFFFSFAAASVIGGKNQCNTGNAQCCKKVYQAKSAEAHNILKNVIGLDIDSITGLVGDQCSPLTIVDATDSGTCKFNAVCCTDNKQTGGVNVGCVPVRL